MRGRKYPHLDLGPHPMPSIRTLLNAVLGCLILCSMGCSSLGLSLFPSGHYLTAKAETVLEQSPRHARLPRELELGVVPAHYLQPGDVLLIEPVDPDSEVRIPADQNVLADGSIDLGKFGRVMVAGLTLEMTENLIERTIVEAGEEMTQVNVRLLEPVHRYYVLGAVNSPGSYPLEGNETILDGIVTAGGLTSDAAPCKILLARPTPASSCRIALPVCYHEITQLGDTTTNYQLQPGDRIFVASRTWCEELMFWKATKSCDRCCDCQSACVDPAILGYSNPVTEVSPGPATASDRLDMMPIEIGVENGGIANSAAVERETMMYPADPSELEPASPPTRLPAAIDGELEFGPGPPDQRFEPMWIKPAPDSSSLEPQPVPEAAQP